MQFDIVANDKASGTMGNVDRSMGKFATSVSSKFTMLAARATALVAVTTKVAGAINEMGKVSDEAAKLGISVEEYQKLKMAAEQYGISIEEIAKAQKDVNKMLDEAATKKKGPAMETLQALGFSEQDIIDRKIKQAEVFERIAEAIKGARSEEEKFAIASRVFGDKIAQGLVPVLEGYKEFQSVQNQTTTLSKKNADNLDRLGDKFNEFFTFAKAAGAETIGYLAGKMMDAPEPKFAVTPEQKAAQEKLRDALLKPTTKESTKAKAGEFSSMAQVGAASFRGFPAPAAKPIEEQQLTELKTIAANTSPDQPAAPTPGSTDMTKPSGNPISSVADTIRGLNANKPSRMEQYRAMRPAR